MAVTKSVAAIFVRREKKVGMEKLTGAIYLDDITELVIELNLHKERFGKVVFDRRNDHFVFEIEHEDSKDEKKLYKIIEKHIRKINKSGKKGRVKREKNGLIDEVVE
jgi:hypothetical protein